VRDWVSVAAWTKPASPERLREEVMRAVAEGYTTMKMHTCEWFDVFEQNRVVEEVAPEGFKFHYDFNYNRTLVTVLPVIQELEKSRVVGFIEDPLPYTDFAGWRELRNRTRIPLIMMKPPFAGGQEIILGLADAYMTAGSIGEILQAGAVWAGANVPGLIQITGGTLSKALTLHLAAVMLTHTMHSVNLDDQYEDDIVVKRIPVVEGSSPVPEGPGLGCEVDEEALAALAANPPWKVPPYISAVRFKEGHTIYFRGGTKKDIHRMTGKEEGTIRGLHLTEWIDDGSAEFRRIYDRLQKEGAFIE
jgi:L-alanine-DL-glutamate epimerase-like enolase superfamily enzyme